MSVKIKHIYEPKQPQTPLQRARQILANAPAALVTIQADGSIVIVAQQGRIVVTGQLDYWIE